MFFDNKRFRKINSLAVFNTLFSNTSKTDYLFTLVAMGIRNFSLLLFTSAKQPPYSRS